MRCEPIGSRYFLSPDRPLMMTCGERFSAPTVSTMMFCARPVTRSVSSRRFSPFHDVAELDVAADLRQDRRGERIPLDELLAGDDLLAFGDLDGRAVDDGVALLLAPLVVDDRDLAVAVDDDEVAVLALDGRDREEPDRARVLGRVLGLLGDARGRAAVVERPHRELRAGLADRLRRDDADGLADLDHLAGREHAAVAEAADAALGLAGQHRADLDALDARLLHAGGELLGDLVADPDDLLFGERIEDVLLRDAADDAVAERLERVAALHDGR